MRRVALVSLALAVTVAVVSGVAATRRTTPSAEESVTVDLKAVRQVIQGFGSSERVWIDPHLSKSPNTSVPHDAQVEILTALYRRLGLTRVRPVLDGGVQKQPGGPFDFSGKLGDAHAAFVKQARPYGLKTVFPGPVYLEDWMTESDPGAYVAWAMAVLRRWRADGVELQFYAPLNEPQIAGNFAPEWLRQVVRQLGAQMRAEGFETKLVIPDDENPIDAYRRATVVLADPVARQYVGALAYHIYKGGPEDYVPMRQLATRYGLPVWMTEYASTDYVDWNSSLGWAQHLHDLLTTGGVNAVDYIWSFFGSWVRTDTMISIDFDNGTYKGLSYTPIYWITGQYSRFVKPGYRRVAVAQTAGAVLASAYRGGGHAIVVATNLGDSPQAFTVSFRNGVASGSVTAIRSSARENWRRLLIGKVKVDKFRATVPPKSITTFVVDAK